MSDLGAFSNFQTGSIQQCYRSAAFIRFKSGSISDWEHSVVILIGSILYRSEGFALTGYVVPAYVEDGTLMLWEKFFRRRRCRPCPPLFKQFLAKVVMFSNVI